jgi:ubiquinone biosynthesis protein
MMVAVGVVVVIALAIGTTAMSMRLLAIRRGWSNSLFAATVGWGGATIVALGLADWDWGSDGLVIQLAAMGIPATMAVAVSLDLLARPGSLAVGERAGLVVAPHPVRAVLRQIAVLRRYRELMQLVRRERFGPFPAHDVAGPAEPDGVRLRRLLEDAGGVYIKLGQIASTRVDLLPPELCEELAELQNRVAPEPVERIKPVLEAELGRAVDEVFAEFDWEPLAAASIGQTYRARLQSGEAVVVKVQRPDVAEVIERDLAALSLVANVAQRRTELGQAVRAGEMLDHFGDSLRAELDFRREADAMVEMSTLPDGTSPVRVPRVHRRLCTRRLLVQERFDGLTLADAMQLADAGIDGRDIADRLTRATLQQILTAGTFHADPHPGNIFVFADGSIGLIDFGAVGRLDPIQQNAIVDMLAAFVNHDTGLLRDAVERVADVAETVSPERLERALARLVAHHVRPNGVVDPAVMQDLVRLLAEFGIRLPADLVLLSRAMVTLDGTLRSLAPGLSLVAAATEQMRVGESPVASRDDLVRAELLAALPHLRHLPDRVDRILTWAGRGQLRIRHVVDEDRQRILRTLVNRALLVVTGSAILVSAVLLLVASEAGPSVAQGTGLFEVFGYGGLLAGTVLLLRVVAGVARDGTT